MASRARENAIVVARLTRVVEVLETELREIPFLPDNIKESVQGTISYLTTRCNVLQPQVVETAEEN